MKTNYRTRLSRHLLTSLFAVVSCWVLGVPSGAGQQTDSPLSPTKETELLDGRSLNGWSSWLVDSKHDDPCGIFSVHRGVLRISGEGLGYLATVTSYRDYYLVIEYRWGTHNAHFRKGKARDSGLFLHTVGPDGNSLDGGGAFKAGIECQIMEGAVGDLMLIRGHDEQNRVYPLRLRSTIAAQRDRDGWPYFDPVGKAATLEIWGRLNRIGKSNRWQDRFGFRVDGTPEHAPPHWNRLECLCRQARIEIRLNGQLVNMATDVWPTAGPILLQCEGSEVFFRTVKLLPLPAQ